MLVAFRGEILAWFWDHPCKKRGDVMVAFRGEFISLSRLSDILACGDLRLITDMAFDSPCILAGEVAKHPHSHSLASMEDC